MLIQRPSRHTPLDSNTHQTRSDGVLRVGTSSCMEWAVDADLSELATCNSCGRPPGVGQLPKHFPNLYPSQCYPELLLGNVYVSTLREVSP